MKHDLTFARRRHKHVNVPPPQATARLQTPASPEGSKSSAYSWINTSYDLWASLVKANKQMMQDVGMFDSGPMGNALYNAA